jgi:uncharacterized protein
MIKIITIALCLVALYWIIFARKKKDNTSDLDNDVCVSVACSTCDTYVSSKEAIIVKGKYYCSKKCLE